MWYQWYPTGHEYSYDADLDQYSEVGTGTLDRYIGPVYIKPVHWTGTLGRYIGPAYIGPVHWTIRILDIIYIYICICRDFTGKCGRITYYISGSITHKFLNFFYLDYHSWTYIIANFQYHSRSFYIRNSAINLLITLEKAWLWGSWRGANFKCLRNSLFKAVVHLRCENICCSYISCNNTVQNFKTI